ncbi:F-box only protein 15-like [Sphaeramia orbicularis]|uniref:F-box only protein 15-like n=1 Tax=Sphaeramia orbicularis TaxID=375764 RepID=UPI00117F99AC|nr:F-box only protein 15-like [Sphaeramia orbicularis]
MAAGRGQFFQSFLKGLERKPGKPAPDRRQPGPGRGKLATEGCLTAGKRSETRRKAVLAPRLRRTKSRLPFEILTKILSYLDAPSLFCVSHVSKLFYQLANDEVIWHKIYLSEFGKNQMWLSKLVDDTAHRVKQVETENQRSFGQWKKMYFKTLAGQEVNKWRRQLRDISPYTGLPTQTEWVLRNLNVSWELMVCDRFGRKVTLEQTRVYYFETSVIVCWSNSSLPRHHHTTRIQLHGVRKGTLGNPRANWPNWHSLMLKSDLSTHPFYLIGKDRLIKLVFLSPGFIIGISRGRDTLAFIMVCLHFHRLVEKSLLGSPVCPYSEPIDRPLADHSDPEYGLHGYTLHFVLHNTGTQIMSGYFPQLSCRAVQIRNGLVELKVINRTNVCQHRTLSGNIKMPWKTEELKGSVENCCVMSLTLLDEFQTPFWCVSAPVSTTVAKKCLSFDYSGKHFLIEYRDEDGHVKMMLVWLEEERQFFLISFTIYLSVNKVNKHFSTNY